MTAPVRILIVDDESQSRRMLRTLLADEGYRASEARTAGEALAAVRARHPDLVLLELDLPDADGIDVIRSLRDEGSTKPIIVVSSRDREEDKVKALELGADDYVTKPFSGSELMARIRVALRREAVVGKPGSRSRSALRTGDLEVDLERRLVRVGRREVHLTPQEYKLLAYLMKHVGKVVTHPRLLHEIWGPSHTTQRAYLRVYIAQLRRKLEADPANPRYLLTEPGVGYSLKDQA